MILFFVTGRQFDTNFYLQAINVAQITLSPNVFTVYSPFLNNKFYCPKLGTTDYVKFNVICLKLYPRLTLINF